MGKAGLYLKISLLTGALALVVWGIRSMTAERVQAAFTALGIEPGASGPSLQAGGIPLAEGEIRRTLCQTRVHAIRFPDGRSVVELKKGLDLNWVAEEQNTAQTAGNADSKTTAANGSQPRVLNYLAIEKWFSQHCQFNAATSEASAEDLEPSNEPVKYVLIEYIDGERWEIYRSGDVLLSGSDPKDRFRSPDFDQALNELRSIAGFPVDMKDR